MAQAAWKCIAERVGAKTKFQSDVLAICAIVIVGVAALWAVLRPLDASDTAAMTRSDDIAAENTALQAPPNVIMQAERGEICSANEKGEFFFTQNVSLGPGWHHYVILPCAEAAKFRLDNTIVSVNIVDRRGGESIAKNGNEDITHLLDVDRTLKFYPVDGGGRRASDVPPFFLTVAFTSSIDEVVTWPAPLTSKEREEQPQ